MDQSPTLRVPSGRNSRRNSSALVKSSGKPSVALISSFAKTLKPVSYEVGKLRELYSLTLNVHRAIFKGNPPPRRNYYCLVYKDLDVVGNSLIIEDVQNPVFSYTNEIQVETPNSVLITVNDLNLGIFGEAVVPFSFEPKDYTRTLGLQKHTENTRDTITFNVSKHHSDYVVAVTTLQHPQIDAKTEFYFSCSVEGNQVAKTTTYMLQSVLDNHLQFRIPISSLPNDETFQVALHISSHSEPLGEFRLSSDSETRTFPIEAELGVLEVTYRVSRYVVLADVDYDELFRFLIDDNMKFSKLLASTFHASSKSSLQSLLNSRRRKFFALYMEKSFCAEVLNCYLQFCDFETIYDQSKRQETAINLWNRFFVKDAEEEINLPKTVSDKIKAQLRVAPPDLFQVAKSSLFDLMWSNYWLKYHESPFYTQSLEQPFLGVGLTNGDQEFRLAERLLNCFDEHRVSTTFIKVLFDHEVQNAKNPSDVFTGEGGLPIKAINHYFFTHLFPVYSTQIEEIVNKIMTTGEDKPLSAIKAIIKFFLASEKSFPLSMRNVLMHLKSSVQAKWSNDPSAYIIMVGKLLFDHLICAAIVTPVAFRIAQAFPYSKCLEELSTTATTLSALFNPSLTLPEKKRNAWVVKHRVIVQNFVASLCSIPSVQVDEAPRLLHMESYGKAMYHLTVFFEDHRHELQKQAANDPSFPFQSLTNLLSRYRLKKVSSIAQLPVSPRVTDAPPTATQAVTHDKSPEKVPKTIVEEREDAS